MTKYTVNQLERVIGLALVSKEFQHNLFTHLESTLEQTEIKLSETEIALLRANIEKNKKYLNDEGKIPPNEESEW